MMLESITREIVIDGRILEADLAIPVGAKALILFAHGSGSSRHSTRNHYLAEVLNKAGFATLLVDLLSSGEKEADVAGRHLRYNIELLASRFKEVTNWLLQEPHTKNLKIGYFGSSTGAAAAIIAATSFSNNNENNSIVKALVLRGGRPDLAEGQLQKIIVPTLLIVGGSDDAAVLRINKIALKELKNAKDRELVVIPGAGHLFEEPGKMEEVAKIAAEWFEIYLLSSGKKFENKYAYKKKGLRLLSSIFKDKPHIHIKFKDRVAAGEMLAALLGKYKGVQEYSTAAITVIGIPRGGIVVADAVAKKLGICDFDIVISRKLRAPNNSENAIGAIMQDGSVYLENKLVESMKVSNQYLEMEKSEQKKEIGRRMSMYRPETAKEYKIKGRTVILIDDGAATGATIIAAAGWIRKQNPKHLIIALPIAPSQIKTALRQQADILEIAFAPSNFTNVEQFYQNFDVVSDQEIIKLLERYRKAAA
jgi:putative phosphoribosyl transferase